MTMNGFGEDATVDLVAAWVLGEFLLWAETQADGEQRGRIEVALGLTGLLEEGLRIGCPLEAQQVQVVVEAVEWLRHVARMNGFDLMADFLGEEAQRFRAALRSESGDNGWV